MLLAILSSAEANLILKWVLISMMFILPVLAFIVILIDRFAFAKKEYVWLDNHKDIEIMRGENHLTIQSMNPKYPLRRVYKDNVPKDVNIKDTHRFYFVFNKGYLGYHDRGEFYVYRREDKLGHLTEEQYDRAWDHYYENRKRIDQEVKDYISSYSKVGKIHANPPEDKDHPELWQTNNWIWFLQWEDDVKEVVFND